ncbi:MAG: TetR/AcrR family transcriptional regulator [Rhodococcus sp. (in: high G+C Gram-positive bacteria)]|uniref:TetR/AcrR family transcriptional regulator n=1 Tax=Rhodococcus sp. TaxID=1831 RepID=UPI003BAFC1EE
MTTAPTARQREFIDIARREFVDHGYGASSIRTIAQRAGVSLSALYYHYASKQDLLVAILDDGLATFLDMCRDELERCDDTPESRLRAMVAGFVRFRTLHQEQSRLVQTEVRNLEPDHLKGYQARQHAPLQTLAGIIDDGVREGVFRTPYPDDARRAIISMCNAIANWYRSDGPDSVDEIVERYGDLALVIVEARPTQTARRTRKKVD